MTIGLVAACTNGSDAAGTGTGVGVEAGGAGGVGAGASGTGADAGGSGSPVVLQVDADGSLASATSPSTSTTTTEPVSSTTSPSTSSQSSTTTTGSVPSTVSSTTTTTARSTTTTGGGGDGGITGASCAPNGSVTVSRTIRVGPGETYDGGCRVHVVTFGDGSQAEGQDPVIRVDGGTVRNVIIGDNGADGIHVYGDSLVENVTWQDVGEDALTIGGEGDVVVRNIEGYDAADKFFQVNAPSTLTVENCIINNAGKALRQNGGTTFTIHVTFNRCRIVNTVDGVFRSDSSTSTIRLTNSELSNARRVCNGNWASCTTSNVTGS